MPRAIWEGKVLAEAPLSECVSLEGNTYFPVSSIQKQYFRESTDTTVCPWKGTANYYDIVVDGKENKGACWYYANPSARASPIRGFVAFWKGVRVEN